ncbi:MAG: arsenite methyltransferase [bacterium]|nr:arsenite methyltransferase [bacterium]
MIATSGQFNPMFHKQESYPMDSHEIKKNVRKRYGKVARKAFQKGCGCKTKFVACCDSDSITEEAITKLSQQIGVSHVMSEPYSEEERAAIPEGADLGLGCGVPTRYAHFKPGETVLDLGCGAGVDSFIAARAVGPSGKVIGVDMTPEMVAQARRNKIQLGVENVEFLLGEIEQLPIESSVVDIVISNCVINLVPDKVKAFSEIYRVLKTGGRMVVSDLMIYGDLPESVRSDIEAWAACIAGAPKVEEYLNFIRSAGLQNVKILKESHYDWGVGENYRIVSCVVESWK